MLSYLHEKTTTDGGHLEMKWLILGLDIIQGTRFGDPAGTSNRYIVLLVQALSFQ